MEIEFVAEDNLPEDSLIRHLVADLFGKITLYKEWGYTFGSQNLSVIIHLEITSGGRYTMSVELLTNSCTNLSLTYNSKPNLPIVCRKLFDNCLNDIGHNYRRYYAI